MNLADMHDLERRRERGELANVYLCKHANDCPLSDMRVLEHRGTEAPSDPWEHVGPVAYVCCAACTYPDDFVHTEEVLGRAAESKRGSS
jgi:hypothetical protein